MSALSTRVLPPSETQGGDWVAVIEGYHVKALSQDHAERIIEIATITHSMGSRKARTEIRVALGLRAFGDHVTK